MNQRECFQVGVKLIGLYSLVYVLTTFLGVLPTVIALVSSSNVADKFNVHQIISLLLLTAVGLYLLRARRFVHRIVFPTNESAVGENLPDYFTVGTKLYGVFVALGTIPLFLKSLAGFLFFLTQDFQHADIVAEATSTRVNFAPDLAVIVFGIFLFIRGELLTRWAFPSSQENMNTDD